MLLLKQSTAINLKIGPFLAASNGDTVQDGLTISDTTIWVSKNHAALAHLGQTVAFTAQTQGLYVGSVSAADTNTAGAFQLWVHVADALAVWHEYMILPGQVYDSFVAGTDALQVHVNEITAGLISAGIFATDAITSTALAASALAEINAEVDTALADYDAPTKAEMDSGFGALNDIAAADVWGYAIDGTQDAQESLMWVMAYVAGAITVTDNSYSYKNFGGTLTLF